MQLILCARILIQQTLHKPDFQTQDQSVVFSPCLSFSPSTCLSSSNLTGLEPWTSRSCPQQFWRPGKRNPARLGRPVPGCCYLSQLCSLCSLLGYNLTKGKVKSLNSCRWVVFYQFMSPHHSDQMSQRSQVSGVALCTSKVPGLTQWVTRSPIELLWTAKNQRKFGACHRCPQSASSLTMQPSWLDEQLNLEYERSIFLTKRSYMLLKVINLYEKQHHRCM